MAVDFTPTLVGYSNQEKLRFWCQKVLPLVYDDSLSYYELLNKVVLYLNNAIQDVANAETNIDSLFDSFLELQDYVNSFGDEISAIDDNVAAALQAKLDAETAEAGAESAKADAESALASAESAVADAESAKTAAQTAANRANASAAYVSSVVDATAIEWTDNAYIRTNYDTGTEIDLTPTPYNSYRCAVVDCTEGDVFCLCNVMGGSTPRLYAFVDDENKLLYTKPSSTLDSGAYYILVTPENAVKAIFNDHHDPLNGNIYVGIPLGVKDAISKLNFGETRFASTVVGTTRVYRFVELPVGHYLLHVDSIESADTDSAASVVIITNENEENLMIHFLERNKPVDLFFDLFEPAAQISFFAGESMELSADDAFTYNNVSLTLLSGISEKEYENAKYKKYPYHELPINPYTCHFNKLREVISTTHAHCLDDTTLYNYMQHYDHVAFSNYHPSVPWYPLTDFFNNPLLYQMYKNTPTGTKLTQVTINLPAGDYQLTVDEIESSDTDNTTSCIAFVYADSSSPLKIQLARGEPVTENFTLTGDATSFYVYAGYDAGTSNGDTFTWTNLTIYRKISNAYDNFLASPCAEYTGFSEQSYPDHHINAVGSFYSRETSINGDTEEQVISECLSSMQYPQMGGITLNHPSYSGTLLTAKQVYDMVNEYPFFAIEIYNSTCEASYSSGYALTQWDYVLAKGKQLFGLAVPDHELQYHPNENRKGFGYSHVMVRAKTEQQILEAYAKGRYYSSIYNDTLKFTDIYYDVSAGLTVRTSESATIKIITANGVVSTVTGTLATYTPTYDDVYIRIEATNGSNTLYSNAIMIKKTTEAYT